MGSLSFDIVSAQDFFRKLEEDYRDFTKDVTSSRNAINCALTAWHLTDWIYNQFPNLGFSSLYKFQENIKVQCPSLQIMHDISNGSKHYTLTKHQPEIKNTEHHRGSFSNDFSRDFDISSLDIEMKSGQKLFFEDEILKVIEFWRNYFRNTLSINV